MVLCLSKLSLTLFQPKHYSLSLSQHYSFLSGSDPNCIFSSESNPLKATQMKKFVVKLELHDNKDKRKALKTVSTLSGIDSIAMDMKDKKLTVIGTADPVNVVSKLRKFWPTTVIISVGPAKEPEKKEEAKKEEPKKEEAKEEPKKEEAKKEEEKKEEPKKEEPKKEEEKKKEPEVVPLPLPPLPLPPQVIMPYRPYYPQINTHYYPQHHSIEENPNACVIC